MQVTGYKIREAIQHWELKKEALQAEWGNSLSVYEDEDRRAPETIFEEIRQAELAVARLQTVQTQFNLAVKVDILGESISLCETVKRVGGAGRLKNLWAGATTPRRNFYGPEVRDPSMNYAEATVTPKEVMDQQAKAQKYTNALRTAISTANAVTTNLDVDPKLFE